MQDKTYNGWTNYATWRVNLEMFDGFDPHEYDSFSDSVVGEGDVAKLASLLEDYAQDYIFDSTEDGLVQHFALAFISDVNWHEIAKNMVAEFCENG